MPTIAGTEVGRFKETSKRDAAIAASLATRAEKRAAAADPEALLGQLADAAYGTGLWKDLDAPRRLVALVKLMEYKVGKAGAVQPSTAEPESGAIETMTII